MKKLFLLGLLACAFAGTPNQAQAAASNLMNYQGSIKSATTNQPVTKTMNMTFKIYNQEAGGNAIWTENDAVAVENGFFNVYLGRQQDLDLDFANELWMEITLDNGEVLPRTRFAATPYSFQAGIASEADTANIAKDVVDGVLTWAKFNDASKVAGGVLNGTYPNPGINSSALMDAIPQYGIPGDKITPGEYTHISTSPAGPAYGDVEGSIFPTLYIAPNKITSAHLQAGAVTTEKIADLVITTDKLAAASVTAAKLADNSVSSNNIINGTIATEDIANKAITNDLLANNSVTSNNIVNGTIQNDDLADGIINNAKLAANSVNSENIINGTIATEDIANNAITNPLIANNAVTNDKIANTTIQASKLSSVGATANQVLLPDGQGGVVWGTIPPQTIVDASITTSKIADKAVTVGKLSSDGALTNQVLIPDGQGGVKWSDLPDNTVGSNNIKNGSIATIDIADGAITNPKLADNSVSTNNMVDGSITGDKLANGIVTTAKLADGAVTSGKILDGTIATADIANIAITTEKIKDLAVTPNKISSLNATSATQTLVPDVNGGVKWAEVSIADGSVTTVKLADGAVTNAKLGPDAVLTGNIKDGEVKTADLADNAVTTDKILNASVTNAKLAENSVKTQNIVDGTIANADLAENAVASKNIIQGAVISDKIADGAVVTAKIADKNVTTEKLADAAVTNGKLAADAVTTANIKNGEVMTDDLADGAVVTTKVAEGAITGTKLADNTITADKIQDKAVKTAKLDDGAVTTEKIADAAVTTVKLHDAAVTNAKLAADAVTSANIKNGEVMTDDLANGAVVTAKIGDKQITDAKIQDNTISTGKLQNGAVDNTKLADNAVKSNNIVDGEVKTADLADASVTDAKLAAGAITTDKIADDAVTMAKLAPGSVYGQMMFCNGTDWVYTNNTTAPTNGQIIKSKIDANGNQSIGWADPNALPIIDKNFQAAANATDKEAVKIIRDEYQATEAALVDLENKNNENGTPVTKIVSNTTASTNLPNGALQVATTTNNTVTGNTFAIAATSNVTDDNASNNAAIYGGNHIHNAHVLDGWIGSHAGVAGNMIFDDTELSNANGAGAGVYGFAMGGAQRAGVLGVTGGFNAVDGRSAGVYASTSLPTDVALYATSAPQNGKYTAEINDKAENGRGMLVKGASVNTDAEWQDADDSDNAVLVVKNTNDATLDPATNKLVALGAEGKTAIKTYGDIWANSAIGAKTIIGTKVVVGDPDANSQLTLTPAGDLNINTNVIAKDITGDNIKANKDLTVDGNATVEKDLTVNGTTNLKATNSTILTATTSVNAPEVNTTTVNTTDVVALGTITAPEFVGHLTGNVTGTATEAIHAANAENAKNAELAATATTAKAVDPTTAGPSVLTTINSLDDNSILGSKVNVATLGTVPTAATATTAKAVDPTTAGPSVLTTINGLANNSILGSKINVATLSKVPTAVKADNATNADHATNAAIADLATTATTANAVSLAAAQSVLNALNASTGKVDEDNLPNTIVYNDRNANFGTNTVTASKFIGAVEGNVTGKLTGDVTGNVTGNLTGTADVAKALETTASTGASVIDAINANTDATKFIKGSELDPDIAYKSKDNSFAKVNTFNDITKLKGGIQVGYDVDALGTETSLGKTNKIYGTNSLIGTNHIEGTNQLTGNTTLGGQNNISGTTTIEGTTTFGATDNLTIATQNAGVTGKLQPVGTGIIIANGIQIPATASDADKIDLNELAKPTNPTVNAQIIEWNSTTNKWEYNTINMTPNTGSIGSDALASTGVTAGTYGSARKIPVLTIDEDGRITNATTADVAEVDPVAQYVHDGKIPYMQILTDPVSGAVTKFLQDSPLSYNATTGTTISGDLTVTGASSFGDDVEVGTTASPANLSVKGNLDVTGVFTNSGAEQLSVSADCADADAVTAAITANKTVIRYSGSETISLPTTGVEAGRIIYISLASTSSPTINGQTYFNSQAIGFIYDGTAWVVLH